MQIDALALAALADEFSRDLRGARVDDVISPTPTSVALQVFGGVSGGRNRWLLASASQQFARIYTTERKPRKLTSEPPAFVMLLRKHLEGARVVEVRQPRWERIVELGFARGSGGERDAGQGSGQGSGQGAQVWLVAEIMGGQSNVILRDARGIILGALRQVSGAVNTYRAIQPNAPYRTPPPQTRTLHGETLPRLAGEDVAGGELAEAAHEALAAHALALAAPADAASERTPRQKGRRRLAAPTVVSVLAGAVEGFTRDLGAEVAARALGAPDAPLAPEPPWDDLARETRALAALMQTRDWRPTLVYPTPASARPEAFAVYAPRRFAGAELRPAPGANAMLATYFGDAEWQATIEGAKGDLRRLLQTQRERAQRKAEALRDELRALDETPALRVEADTLLAYQSEIAPGAPSVTLANPFAVEDPRQPATLTLTLDPQLSAVENANRRYARYHKLQRAASQIPPQIEANELELARIEQLQTDLTLAETPAEIAQARAELAEAGYLRGAQTAKGAKGGKPARAQKGGKSGKGDKNAKGAKGAKGAQQASAPLRRESMDGLPILIGKNSRQNEEVTFHLAGPNDVWLHARGVPGAHVIVKTGGRTLPETTLREAAGLAAYYSQAREAGSAPVDYTEQRYVRHMKGGGPGMVIYERERTLHVAPDEGEHP